MYLWQLQEKTPDFPENNLIKPWKEPDQNENPHQNYDSVPKQLIIYPEVYFVDAIGSVLKETGVQKSL